MVSDAILLSIIASSTAVLLLLVRYCFYSKCKTIKICGCVECDRDTEHEIAQPELQSNSPTRQLSNIQNQV